MRKSRLRRGSSECDGIRGSKTSSQGDVCVGGGVGGGVGGVGGE